MGWATGFFITCLGEGQQKTVSTETDFAGPPPPPPYFMTSPLERFLTGLSAYLFNHKNRNKFKDNLSSGKREALRDMKRWKRDPENPKVVRVQDKGSRFVIDWKST